MYPAQLVKVTGELHRALGPFENPVIYAWPRRVSHQLL